jgi:hypothetical protein
MIYVLPPTTEDKYGEEFHKPTQAELDDIFREEDGEDESIQDN